MKNYYFEQGTKWKKVSNAKFIFSCLWVLSYCILEAYKGSESWCVLISTVIDRLLERIHGWLWYVLLRTLRSVLNAF